MSLARSRTAAIARKELVQIVRDPRSLAIALLMPVLMLVIYGYGISSDVNDVRIGVVDWSQSQESRDLVQSIVQTGYFQSIGGIGNPDELSHSLDSRVIQVGLIIPADFARKIQSGAPGAVAVVVDGSDPNVASVVSSYVDAIVGSYSARTTFQLMQRRGLAVRTGSLAPLDFRPRVWYNEDLRSINFIVPGLIATIMMTMSALLTSGAVARERERGTLEQLVASVLRPYELMVGKILAYTLLALLDVVLVVLVGVLWFGVPLRGSVTLLFVCSLIFLMSSLGVGLLVSAAAPTQQAAMSGAMLLTMVPGIILSGFMFPIESMPRLIQYVTYLVPARYFLVIVRGIFLKGDGVSELWQPILLMSLFGATFLLASIFTFRKRL